MDEKRNEKTVDRVTEGVELFARVETDLSDAVDVMLELRRLFETCYAKGDIPSGRDAIQAMDSCLEIVGGIGVLKQQVMALHDTGKSLAEDAGNDVARPYAELPPREVSTRSGGR